MHASTASTTSALAFAGKDRRGFIPRRFDRINQLSAWTLISRMPYFTLFAAGHPDSVVDANVPCYRLWLQHYWAGEVETAWT